MFWGEKNSILNAKQGKLQTHEEFMLIYIMALMQTINKDVVSRAINEQILILSAGALLLKINM